MYFVQSLNCTNGILTEMCHSTVQRNRILQCGLKLKFFFDTPLFNSILLYETNKKELGLESGYKNVVNVVKVLK